MNVRQSVGDLQETPLDACDEARIAALSKYELENFQELGKGDLLLAQSLAGHGEKWGIWETPASISPGRLGSHYRRIDLAKRLRAYLKKEQVSEESVDALLDEGVLNLTRIALLLRLAPTGGKRKNKVSQLKPSTLAQRLYLECPQVIARAIRRKAVHPEASGLFACMTDEDVTDLRRTKACRIELDRLETLNSQGLWADMPPLPDILTTTDPRGKSQRATEQVLGGEYQPIPDDYLAEIGPRVLWIVRELGPHLTSLLDELADLLERLDWSTMTKAKLVDDYGLVNKFIAEHLRAHPWMDLKGKPLRPHFPLITGAKAKDRFEWPPRTYEHLKVLSVTLQSAHLFVTLLACAGRIGEIETLARSCVSTSRDGKHYVFGWTYKLSENMFGDTRQWPAPEILVQALGQQARLAATWSRLPPGALERGLPSTPASHQSLWLSLGSGGSANSSDPLSSSHASLPTLAIRVGMDPKPGGVNLHPHRFRKTIGRLAGVALFNSPLVLKRLFGHKSIEMTLRYILCDKDIRTEAERVLRELRILHCADMLEEIRQAVASGKPLPGHYGVATTRLEEAVKEHEGRLTRSGRLWSEGSAYDLAYLLTANGQGWRFVTKNVVCTKVPGEPGLCSKSRQRGEPNTSNCKSECNNRIVLAISRRDAAEVLESYLDVARRARQDEQYLVCYEAMERFKAELEDLPDMKAQYLAMPEVESLMALCQEMQK
jgi:integrase